MKKKQFLLMVNLFFLFLVTGFQLKADEFDLSDEREILFASKRSNNMTMPKQSKMELMKSLSKEHQAVEMNLFFYDKLQGKVEPIYNKVQVKAGTHFSISFMESSQNNDKKVYAYIYHVHVDGKVKKLFPISEDVYEKNPLVPNIEYSLPKDKWEAFSNKKGKEYIYIFLTEKSYDAAMNKLQDKKALDRTYRRMANKKARMERVKDLFKVNKDGKSGSLYSNILAYKGYYAERLIIHNKG